MAAPSNSIVMPVSENSEFGLESCGLTTGL
jgi:hypothetical protein